MARASDTPVHRLPHVVRALKAMAHPVRLRLLAMLATGELCVCQMTAVLNLAASTVSGHLADLRAAGLVIERRDGKWVHYRLADDPAVAAVVRESLAMLAADHQVHADASVARQVRCLPVETVSAGQFTLAASKGRGRACCPPRPARRAPSHRATAG